MTSRDSGSGWVAIALAIVTVATVVFLALMGIDAFGDVPAWLWLFAVAWLGIYVPYPVWSFWFGRRLIGS